MEAFELGVMSILRLCMDDFGARQLHDHKMGFASVVVGSGQYKI
jgi:hypothetical protein